MRSSVMAFTASRVGEEIVMEVDYAQGLPRKDSDALAPRGQWIFDQIKPDSFHWRAVMSRDGGKTWQLQQEMFVQRRKERPGKASDGRPCNFGASKSDVEQAKAEVAEIETDWLNALSNANVSAIDSFLAEDFVRPAPEYGQFATKDQVLSFYRSHLSPKNSRRSRIDNLTVSFYGAVALARGAVITTTADNQESSKTLFTDVFVRENGKWKAVSAQENGVPTQ